MCSIHFPGALNKPASSNIMCTSGIFGTNLFCVLLRFALSFGLDALKNREAVTKLHHEGILTAVNPLENPNDPAAPPPNLPFLELLTEFTNKLLKQDKKVVLAYLDKRIAGGMPNSRGEDWQPLLMYRLAFIKYK